MWGNTAKEDRLGKKIAELITNSNMQILNTGKHTRQNLNNHTKSAIDITLCSEEIRDKLEWDCIEDNIGSDHLPIIIQMNTNEYSRKKITNWKKVINELSQYKETNYNDNNNIEIIMEKIIDENTKEITIKNKNSTKIWWNETIQRLWAVKRQKQKCYNGYKNLYTATELARAIAVLKREINKAKKQSWERFVNSINAASNTKLLWNKINKIKNKSENRFNLLEDYEMAKKFINENFPGKIEDIKMPMEITSMNENKFNEEKITEIINRKQNTAPGENKISYKMLKILIKINHDIMKNLVIYLNNIYNKQIYPEKWKIARIIAIKKPNKDQNETESYRPICLQNTLSKIFNDTILEELNQHLTTHNILPNKSYGFRKGHSIMDYFVNLYSEILAEKENNKIQILVSMDITKAFDNINKESMIDKLRGIRTPNHIINWIYQFMTNREVIYNNGTNTIKTTTNKGIPQGSCLSPCLFNIYTHELHKIASEKISLYQFADDIAVLVKGNKEKEVVKETNTVLKIVSEELKKLNLTINENKTTYMRLFKNKPSEREVKINNTTLKEEKTIKLIGITFNNKLSLLPHYKKLEKEIMNATKILKIITNKKGGVHPQLTNNIYKAIIQTRTKFADIITPTNIKNSIQIKQKIINNNLRICSGMVKTTPIPTLLAETVTLPAELDNKLSTMKYIANQINKNNDTGKMIRNKTAMEKINKIYNEYKFLSLIAKKDNKEEARAKNAKNITINEELNKFKKKSLNQLEAMTSFIEILNKYKEYKEVYTDGSLKQSGRGIGIYFKDTGSEIKIKLKNHATIKTIETIAIKTAIEKAIQMGMEKIIIFTDSKSSCTSIKNVNKGNKHKYHETKILEMINSRNIEIIIQWIPGHMEITGNDKADRLANAAIEEADEIIENEVTIEDAHQLIQETIWKEWERRYNDWTVEVGNYNKIINNTPPKKPWYQKTKMSADEIRIINRLRAGHAKNKKFLNMVGIEENNLCDVCQEIEDNQHIFEKCKKYKKIRDKYTLIKNNKLIDILKENNIKNYKLLCNYIKEIEYDI